MLIIFFPDSNIDPDTLDFNSPYSINDIALLELAEEVDLTIYTPVCLAHTGLTEAGMTLLNVNQPLNQLLKVWGWPMPMAGDLQDPLALHAQTGPSPTSFRRLSSASAPQQRAWLIIMTRAFWTASSVLLAPRPTFTV